MGTRSQARVRRAQIGEAMKRERQLKARVDHLEKELAVEKNARNQALERAMGLAEELAREQALRAKNKMHRPLADPELLALASISLLEAATATPVRKRSVDRLIEELTYRGILPPQEPG